MGLTSSGLDELADLVRSGVREDATLNEPLPFTAALAPWRHQVRAARWLAARSGALLQYGLGVGKTRAALDACRLIQAPRILVLGPLRACGVWQQQAELHHPGAFRVLRLDRGSTAKRAERLRDFCASNGSEALDLVAVNYESSWREPLASALIGARFDVAILDEVHRLKGAGATQSRFAALLCKRITRRWGLSGTPMAHSPVDAYGVFRAIDPGVFGTSKAKFLARYAVMGGYGGFQVVGYQRVEEFRERYLSATLVAERDVLDLPPALHQEIDIELPPAAQRIHDDLRRDCVAYLGAPSEDSRAVVAQNVLTRFLRMQQVASGHVKVGVTDPSTGVDPVLTEIHRAKQEALSELFTDLDIAEPVVVFARFKYDLVQVERAARDSKRAYFELSGSRDEADEWRQDPHGPVLGANIASGSEAIDLTHARYCVYYDVPFALAQYEQSLARVHRPGQTRSVTYYHLIARGTIDEYVRAALVARRNVLDKILTDGFDGRLRA
jgi:SNF2 family DNA or RNA helicase